MLLDREGVFLSLSVLLVFLPRPLSALCSPPFSRPLSVLVLPFVTFRDPRLIVFSRGVAEETRSFFRESVAAAKLIDAAFLPPPPPGRRTPRGDQPLKIPESVPPYSWLTAYLPWTILHRGRRGRWRILDNLWPTTKALELCRGKGNFCFSCSNRASL